MTEPRVIERKSALEIKIDCAARSEGIESYKEMHVLGASGQPGPELKDDVEID